MTPASLIKIGLIRQQNPKGKSQEIILLAAFVQTYQQIALEFHDPVNLRSDLYVDKTHREVSGLSPGCICADLSANSLGVSWPPPISDQTYMSTKPMGKSQEVNVLALFGTDLLAIASGFQAPWPAMAMDLNDRRSTTKIRKALSLKKSTDTDLKGSIHHNESHRPVGRRR